MSQRADKRVDVAFSSSESGVLLTLCRNNYNQSVSLRCAFQGSPLPPEIAAGSIHKQSGNYAAVSLELIDIELGIIWGHEIWNFGPSRSLAVGGCDFLIYWNPFESNPLEDELWWVRTYENVIPSFRIRFRDGNCEISSAGPSGMRQNSLELSHNPHGVIQLDLSETELERQKRPYLEDKDVPLKR